jgi:hypothetical protein
MKTRTVFVTTREYNRELNRYENVEKGEAQFHCWGCNYEELNNGVGNYTVAVVEWPDGRVGCVSPESIKFASPFS